MEDFMKKYPWYIKRGNQVARKYGYGKATDIVFGEEEKLVSSVSYGYRKYSTGEYVSKAYLRNFGWKNTYYQEAKCVVMICA
jgi:hypothetical protein